LGGVQSRPEVAGPQAAEQSVDEGPSRAVRVVLEEVRVQPLGGIAQVVPLEPVPALRAARLRQAAEVVVAERAGDGRVRLPRRK